MKGKIATSFVILCGVPFLMVLGNSMLFPIFPRLQGALRLSAVQTSLVVTAFSVPAGILIPVCGYLSDRFGRVKVMAPSVAVFGLGALIGGVSVSVFTTLGYAGLLVGRVVQGMGAAGMSQLATALTADIFKSSERPKALGLLESANGLGKVISPIAGGLIGLVLWWAPFYLFALLAAPLAAGLLFLVKEPKAERAPASVSAYRKKISGVFKAKGASIGAALASGGVGLYILFGTLFYLSEVLEKTYKMPEVTVGFILAIPVGAMSLTSFLIGSYLQKHSERAKSLVVFGLGVVTAVMIVNAFTSSRWILFGAIFFLGIGGGFVLPSLNLLITSATALAERGMITSLLGAVRFIGVAAGPPTFGFLMKSGNAVLFGAAAAVSAAAGVVAFFWIKQAKLLSPETGGGPGEQKPQKAAKKAPGSRKVPT